MVRSIEPQSTRKGHPIDINLSPFFLPSSSVLLGIEVNNARRRLALGKEIKHGKSLARSSFITAHFPCGPCSCWKDHKFASSLSLIRTDIPFFALPHLKPASVFLTGRPLYGFKSERKGRPGRTRDVHHVLQQEAFELVAKTEVR
jgi:hypothetical protein